VIFQFIDINGCIGNPMEAESEVKRVEGE